MPGDHSAALCLLSSTLAFLAVGSWFPPQNVRVCLRARDVQRRAALPAALPADPMSRVLQLPLPLRSSRPLPWQPPQEGNVWLRIFWDKSARGYNPSGAGGEGRLR